MTSENWLPIPGYEGLYEVSDCGRVRSVERTIVDARHTRVFKGRLLVPELRSNTGYHMVSLYKDRVRRKCYVHRLVLIAFRGDPAEGMEACHGNDIRTDNRLENLRWDTHGANVGDAVARGRHRSISSYNGEKTHCHRGHPFDEANTIVRPEGRGCRECKLLMERIRYHRRKSVS